MLLPAVKVLEVGAGGSTRAVIEVVAGRATTHRTPGVVRSWSLLEISSRTLTVTEHFAHEGRWQPAPSQEFVLPDATHRPG